MAPSDTPTNPTGRPGSGISTTTTTTNRDTQWSRRAAWPLLLGSAVVLGGASVANYHFANPDGKLTSKAQALLTQRYPGAKVRIHGRDAIISGLPAGADPQAAHDLVRSIEGVRHVKQPDAPAASAAPVETTAAPVETTIGAVETTAAPVETTAAPAETTVAAVETTVVAGPALAAEGDAAGTTVAATATPTTATPTPTTATPTTATPTTATPTTAAPTTSVAPTTTAPPLTTAPQPVPVAPTIDDLPPAVDILFDPNSSQLDAAAEGQLDELATFLVAHPDLPVTVIGHADAQGGARGKLAISRARANHVARYLISKGVPAARVRAGARADRVPVASNRTVEGRRSNRRVEVVINGVGGTSGANPTFAG